MHWLPNANYHLKGKEVQMRYSVRCKRNERICVDHMRIELRKGNERACL